MRPRELFSVLKKVEEEAAELEGALFNFAEEVGRGARIIAAT